MRHRRVDAFNKVVYVLWCIGHYHCSQFPCHQSQSPRQRPPIQPPPRASCGDGAWLWIGRDQPCPLAIVVIAKVHGAFGVAMVVMVAMVHADHSGGVAMYPMPPQNKLFWFNKALYQTVLHSLYQGRGCYVHGRTDAEGETRRGTEDRERMRERPDR